jgi:hypothetical protein
MPRSPKELRDISAILVRHSRDLRDDAAEARLRVAKIRELVRHVSASAKNARECLSAIQGRQKIR